MQYYPLLRDANRGSFHAAQGQFLKHVRYKSKIGQNNPENRRSLNLTTGSKCFRLLFRSAPVLLKTDGVLQVSKWNKIQVLLDCEEMESLLSTLGPLFFVVVSEIVHADQAVITSASFHDKYAEYINLIKQGQVPPTDEFRRYFSSAMSTSLDIFYAIAAGSDKVLRQTRQAGCAAAGPSLLLFRSRPKIPSYGLERGQCDVGIAIFLSPTFPGSENAPGCQSRRHCGIPQQRAFS